MLPIFQKSNTVLFHGLPPILKGTTLFADGIPNYLLTVDQAINDFYTKIQSDERFLKLSGGNMTGNIFFTGDRSGLGVYWYNINNKLMASVGGGSDGLSFGYYNPNDVSNNYFFSISENFIGPSKDMGVMPSDSMALVQAKYAIRKNAGAKTEQDTINLNEGFYNIKGSGWIYFLNSENKFLGSFNLTEKLFCVNLAGLQPDDPKGYILADTPTNVGDYVLVNKKYLSDNYLALNLDSNKIGSLNRNTIDLQNGIWKFTDTFEDGNSIIFDAISGEKGVLDASQWIAKFGTIQGGHWLDARPVGPALSVAPNSSLDFAQIGHIASIGTKYDAIVKLGSVNNVLNEYNTVRAAIEAGKKRILIKSGIYDASTFWPTPETQVSISNLLIEGEDKAVVIIEGSTIFSPGVTKVISNCKFNNITFKLLNTLFTDQMLFSFNDNTSGYAGYYGIEFENCVFDGVSNSNNIGFNLSYPSGLPSSLLTGELAAEFIKCYFINLTWGICSHQRLSIINNPDEERADGYSIDRCKFNQVTFGITPYFFRRWRIQNTQFRSISGSAINGVSDLQWSGFEVQGGGKNCIEIDSCDFREIGGSAINIRHGGIRNNWDSNVWYSSTITDPARYCLSYPESDLPTSGSRVFYYENGHLYQIRNLVDNPKNVELIHGAGKLKKLMSESDDSCLAIPQDPINYSGNNVAPFYKFWKDTSNNWNTRIYQYKNTAGEYGGHNDYNDWLSGKAVIDGCLNAICVHQTGGGPSFARWAYLEQQTGGGSIQTGWVFYFLHAIKNDGTVVCPAVTSVDSCYYPNTSYEDDIAYVLGASSITSGGIYGKNKYSENFETWQQNEEMCRCQLLTSDTSSIITSGVNYVKIITENSSNRWVYVFVHIAGTKGKIYRAKIEDVINSCEGIPTNATWDLVFTMNGVVEEVSQIIKAQNVNNFQYIYIATNRGVIYAHGSGNLINWIGPKNSSGSLYDGAPRTSLVVFNSNNPNASEKTLIYGYCDTSNKISIIKCSLLNNSDEIYDNYCSGKFQIINNNIACDNFLTTTVMNTLEEIDTLPHNKYILIGNVNETGTLGISERKNDGGYVDTPKGEYILGYMKKTGVPVESEYEKSNILFN